VIAKLPVLLVVGPLAGAALAILLPIGWLARGTVHTVSYASLAGACALIAAALSEGPIGYALGGWLAPSGVALRADTLSATVLTMTNVALAILLPQIARLPVHGTRPQTASLSALGLLFLTVNNGLLLAGDLFSAALLLELASLTACGMVASGRLRRSLIGAFHALLFQSCGTALLLIGTAFIYARTGSLDLVDLAGRIGPGDRLAAVAALLAILGLAIKAGLFPFGSWLGRAYLDAPPPVVAILGGVIGTLAAYVLLRLNVTVVGGGRSFLDGGSGAWLLAVVAAVVVLWPAIRAAASRDLRAVVAWLAAAHLGYVALAAGFSNQAGATAAVAILCAHAVAVTAATLALACLSHLHMTPLLDRLGGVRQRLPMVATALICALLALAGMPLTVGFASRWQVALGAIERGAWPVLAVVALASGVGLLAAGRVARGILFAQAPAATAAPAPTPPLSLALPASLFGLATVYFGLNASLYVGLADQAARLIVRTAP
jgi:multicomponent Na+:H+ antiporter subunit D